MKFEIVVSHFNENLDWMRELVVGFSPAVERTVYTKGDQPPADMVWQHLPNVGLEPHTFLTHIVDRYDNLPDWTLFTQARPFDHVPNLREILAQPTIDAMWAENLRAFSNSRMRSDHVLGLGRYCLVTEDSQKDLWRSAKKTKWSTSKFAYINVLLGVINSELLNLRPCPCTWGQIQLVSREQILANRKATYQLLLNVGEQHGWQMFPYAMENVWWALWDHPSAQWKADQHPVP